MSGVEVRHDAGAEGWATVERIWLRDHDVIVFHDRGVSRFSRSGSHVAAMVWRAYRDPATIVERVAS